MSARVELRNPDEMSDGVRYDVVLVDDVFVDGIKLGQIESFRDTVQQMHKAKGFESIARKTSHPKRWRSRTPDGRWSHGRETRWEAIAALLREQGQVPWDVVAKTAKVVR